MTTQVAGFDWDEGNQEKCRKHGVPMVVIEEVLSGPLAVHPDPVHSAAEERLKAIGLTKDGRGVLVVFTLRQRGQDTLIRPISARYMHDKELAWYEKATAPSRERPGR